MNEYVELRSASAFSFLRASSAPEDLVTRAAELGYSAMALCDRDGFYGSPRFHAEAKQHGLRALVGSDVQTADSGRLLLLVKDQAGYRNLCRLITSAKLSGAPPTLDGVEAHAQGLIAITDGEHALDRLGGIFKDHLYLELGRHFDRAEARKNEAVLARARQKRLPIVATNDVHYARAEGVELCDALTCIREKRSLASAGQLLMRNAERHLKSARQMQQLFYDLPQAIENTMAIASRCGFTLENLGYRFPTYPVPPGETEFSYLQHLVNEGVRNRYRPVTAKINRQIARELQLIAKLELSGYFLIVWDIVEFCRQRHMMAQGRGSAANSAVCYALGITSVDPVGMELLFERFLSEERGEWPDIDIDLPSGDERESVIQYVYRKYGERGSAMTANCITYRMRSALRELGKVLGFGLDELDGMSKQIGHFEYVTSEDELAPRLDQAGLSRSEPRVQKLLRLATQIQSLPRHLGQHSGGMIICAGHLDEVVPLEPASMPGRVVVQWDKDDCADLGIIKVDLLGLGMLAVLEEAVPMVKRVEGVEVDLAHLPANDPKVYAMLERADTVGLFQVESRAQMSTLPRLKPRNFYDLVVEVAIIRPGPIIGQMVHPYLRRRAGREPVKYAIPEFEPFLKRTLGVPLFQEQLMRMSMVAAGFTGGQAEELRRAMGSKRSAERMKAIEAALLKGMNERRVPAAAQEEIIRSIRSFALYGFPESHAASFALIVYASAYLKAHHPAVFCAALLNNWPMGFYHPATLITDVRRHGVRILPIDVTQSAWRCTVGPGPGPGPGPNPYAIRLGLKYVAGLREEVGQRIVAAREAEPVSSLGDFIRRSGANRAELGTLASVGALNPLGYHRRSALWETASSMQNGELFLRGDRASGEEALQPMSMPERIEADFSGTTVSTGPHPIGLLRAQLTRRGIVSAMRLGHLRDGDRVQTAGVVIVRQRPGSAKGFFFLTLEDETGFSNAIVTPQIFSQNRAVLQSHAALIVGGKLQHQDGVISIKADHFAPLSVGDERSRSRDFH